MTHIPEKAIELIPGHVFMQCCLDSLVRSLTAKEGVWDRGPASAGVLRLRSGTFVQRTATVIILSSSALVKMLGFRG